MTKDFEPGRVAQLLQIGADNLTPNAPNRFMVAVRGRKVLFSAEVWTSAMTRDSFVFERSLNKFAVAQQALNGAIPWEDAASPIVEEMIGKTARVQADRWTLAKTHGLVRESGTLDLPASKIVIDRTLVRLLDAVGVDARRMVPLFACVPEYEDDDETPWFTAASPTGQVFARQLGLGLPVASKWIGLRSDPFVSYDGTYLALDGPLPDAVLVSAAGRRLGELIETGLPEFYPRIIAGVHSFGDHPHGISAWDEALGFYVELVPDQVEIGVPI